MGKSGKYTDIKNNKVFIYLYTIPLLPIRISDTQAEGLTSKRELRDSEPRTESKTYNFSLLTMEGASWYDWRMYSLSSLRGWQYTRSS